MPQVRLTFVVEPGIPELGMKQAQQLIRRPKASLVDVPLRWDETRRRWLPFDRIVNEEVLRCLQFDIELHACRHKRRSARRGK